MQFGSFVSVVFISEYVEISQASVTTFPLINPNSYMILQNLNYLILANSLTSFSSILCLVIPLHLLEYTHTGPCLMVFYLAKLPGMPSTQFTLLCYCFYLLNVTFLERPSLGTPLSFLLFLFVLIASIAFDTT